MNPRPSPPSRRRAQRGSTIVEFALIASILIMLLIGIFEFGRVMFYWNTASEAIRLGARTAVVCDVNAAGRTCSAHDRPRRRRRQRSRSRSRGGGCA